MKNLRFEEAHERDHREKTEEENAGSPF